MDSEYSVVTSGLVSDAPVLDGLVAVMPFNLGHGGSCSGGIGETRG